MAIRDKVGNAARSAPPRAARGRQRLIDACISALHVHGPSNTTVERVTAIAKMSPGIVRFYFKSKAAMLVASLQFLADEFERELLLPVAALKATPVIALQSMVDLYLDPQLASPRKVSVWYSFWGEASSRAEYYDLCGKKDENFAALTRELIESLIAQTGRIELDPDAIALGLIGVLEVLWQDIAFQEEASIDRPRVKRRAMNFLTSVFPGTFAGAAAHSANRAPVTPVARREVAPRGAAQGVNWLLAAHVAQFAGARGAAIDVDLQGRSVRLRRGPGGSIRAQLTDGSAAFDVCERDGFIFLHP